KPTPGVMPLSMREAIDRGLKYNLGIILSNQNSRAAAAARLRSLSDLLPKVTGRVGESVQQINLAAFGFPLSPGTPAIVGPFSIFEARATASLPIIDIKAL